MVKIQQNILLQTHLSKEDLISLVPELQDIKDRVFVLDCFKLQRIL